MFHPFFIVSIVIICRAPASTSTTGSNEIEFEAITGISAAEYYHDELPEDASDEFDQSFTDEQFGTFEALKTPTDLQDLLHIGETLGFFHGTFANLSPALDVICGKLTVKSQEIKCYPAPDALNPCEDVMGAKWLRISVWIVVALTVFGNVAVLVVLLSNT